MLGIEKITGGIIFDLGASFHQFNKAERGFSFQKDAPLDMRFGESQTRTAADIINSYSEKELTEIFSKYGEERFSKTIDGMRQFAYILFPKRYHKIVDSN